LSKKGKLNLFDAKQLKYVKVNAFAAFCEQFVLFSPRKGQKHAFLFKNGSSTRYL